MGGNFRNAVARPGGFARDKIIMFDGHPFPEGLHMEEEGLRSALAVGGEGPLVGKELLSPEGNPRQSVSLLHSPYVQEIRLDIVQSLAYSPDGQEMGRQDIPAHAAQGKDVDGLVAHPDGFRGRNGFAEGDPVDVKIFLRFQSMKKGKNPGNRTPVFVTERRQQPAQREVRCYG